MSSVPSRASWATAVVAFVGTLVFLLIARPAGSGDPGSVVTGPIRFLVATLVAAVLLTSLHEAAHAVVGRLLGWEVFGVTLGHGRRLASFQLGSTRLDLRGALVGGATMAKATGERWRDVSMLVAGVTTESAVIALALWWQPASAWGQHAKWAIILVAGLDIAINLWPRRVDVGPVAGMATDGAQLMSVLTTPDQWRSDIERTQLTPSRARIMQTLFGGDVEEALALARVEAAAEPADPAIQTLVGTLLLLDGQWREAFDRLVPLDGACDVDPMLANNTAWAAVMTFDPNLLPHADRYSEQALRERPDEPACANTRGATLVMLGRVEQGLPLLESAAAGRISPKQKAYVLAFTALAEHRRGNAQEANRLLARSESLDRQCPALPEVRRLTLAPPTGRPAPRAAWPPPRPGSSPGRA